MTATDIFLPLGFLVLGIVMAIFSKQVGIVFCRLGKAIWKILTFGLTDMHWFYNEERAPRTMQRLGMVLCVIGFVFAGYSIVSLSGPNSFAAMRQAQSYLKKTYGDSINGYSFSCNSIPNEANGVIVHYKYSGKQGDLHASWDGSKYTFTEAR
jgi:hypothetical protein